jgi:hypothetical protein
VRKTKANDEYMMYVCLKVKCNVDKLIYIYIAE